MLRDESNAPERPWSGPRRVLAASLLVAVAVAASLLHGPALADDRDEPAAGAKAGPTSGTITSTDGKPAEPFDLSYVAEAFNVSYVRNESSQGFVAFRPAAAFQRSGMAIYRTALNLWIAQQWAVAARSLTFDATKPGMAPPRVEWFEQVTATCRFWQASGPEPNGRFAIGDVFTARTTVPLDWVGIFRAFKQDPVEARDGDVVYYQLKEQKVLGPDGAFYCPDDRTVVFGPRKRLLELIHRATPSPAPVFAQGKDWDQAIRGLLLVALDNRGGRLLKAVKNDERDTDIDVTAILGRTDLWAIGLDDSDDLVFSGVGTCPDGAASEATTLAINGILDRILREAVPGKDSPDHVVDKQAQMALRFVEKLRVEHQGRSILLRSAGLGTIAELAALIAENAVK